MGRRGQVLNIHLPLHLQIGLLYLHLLLMLMLEIVAQLNPLRVLIVPGVQINELYGSQVYLVHGVCHIGRRHPEEGLVVQIIECKIHDALLSYHVLAVHYLIVDVKLGVLDFVDYL